MGITFKAESKIENTTPTTLNKQVLTKFGTYGMVQTDLLVAFGRLWNNGLGAYMRQLWTEYCDLYISVKPTTTVGSIVFAFQFSGYSLGACLAQMAAVRFQEEKWWPADQMFYFGYGNPRCGNEDFAYYVDQSLADKFNIMWFNDVIMVRQWKFSFFKIYLSSRNTLCQVACIQLMRSRVVVRITSHAV